jgi:ABC-type lipoprotein export system ATPase subunit
LGKLSFNVQRFVNVENWAERGEALLDLRKTGPFKGKGTLLKLAREKLLKSWTEETAEMIAQTLDTFREEHLAEMAEHAPVEKSSKDEYRQWVKHLAEWFYSTSHIKVSYGIQYDDVNIKQLSPGTRGIVLLLLYLSIDKEDERPLIIDQPEENLDPKSIYVELVSRFRAAKSRRQIFIVTHNANLVVNTDADQVIVAECGDHRPGELPIITYTSGSLENPLIRNKVCDILEGGEIAFKDRARRLRVVIN